MWRRTRRNILRAELPVMKKSSALSALKGVFAVLITARIIISSGIRDFAVFFFAIFVHEIFHVVFMRFFGKEVSFSGPGLFGFGIDCDFSGRTYEKILIFSGGIAGNLLLALITYAAGKKTGTETAFFVEYNLLIAAVNIIPSYPLDGGRILGAVLEVFTGKENAVRAVSICGILLGTVMFISGINLFLFYTDSILLPVMGIFLIYHSDRELCLCRTEYVKELLSSLDVSGVD